MAITTTLQTKYTIQKIFIILVSLVMGLWGVYDYAIKIPRKQLMFDRGQVCLTVKGALDAEPGSAATRKMIADTKGLLRSEFEKTTGIDPAAPVSVEQAETLKSVTEDSEKAWLLRLQLFSLALTEAELRTPGAKPSDAFVQIYELAKRDVDVTGELSEPAYFDRIVQWFFILCLPFVPIFLVMYAKAQKRVYRLDDDGTLHAPEAAWTKAEIADIDMSRWMSKSLAFAVHEDGRRIKLDDYVYRNVNLIAGAIASEMYPDEWDAEAKPISDEDEEDAEVDLVGDGEELEAEAEDDVDDVDDVDEDGSANGHDDAIDEDETTRERT